MLRLVSSSNPDDVTRFNVRAHYLQRLVLTVAVCRELERAPDNHVGGRPGAALELLAAWMRDAYRLPNERDVPFAHGLGDDKLVDYANDLRRELQVSTRVCEALAMLYTADNQSEFDSDTDRLKRSLKSYVAEFGSVRESQSGRQQP